MKKLKKRVAILVFAVLVLFMSFMPTLSADVDIIKYNGLQTAGSKIYYGNNKSQGTALFTLSNSGKEAFGYCSDITTEIKNPSTYTPMLLNEVSSISLPVRQRIRVIVKNSYPVKTISELKAFAGDEKLTLSDAIGVSQALIWKYISSVEINTSKFSASQKKYYEALEKLNLENLPNEEKSEVVFSTTLTNATPEKRSYKFVYSSKTGEGTLSYKFSADLVAMGATVKESEQEGQKVLLIENVPSSSEFTLTISLLQQMLEDVYYLKGTSKTQDLICFTKATNNDEAKIEFGKCDYSLSVTKEIVGSSNKADSFKFYLKDEKGNVLDAFSLKNHETRTYPKLAGGSYILSEDENASYDFISHQVNGSDEVASLITPFVLSSSSKAVSILSKSKPIYNLVVEKRDNVTMKGVPGVVMEFSTSKDFSAEDTFERVTDKDGNINLSGLKYAKYYVREKTPAFGYNGSDEIYEVSLKEGETVVLRVLNDPTPQYIEITKIDKSTKATLQGATISVYTDEALTQMIATVTTDSNGKAIVEGLVPGVYYLKESVAPTGYKLSEDVYKVTIALGTPEAVTFLNSKTSSTPATGDVLPIGLLLAVVISGGGGYLFYKKKKNIKA